MFKVGDKVSAYGMRGIVISDKACREIGFTIAVKFDNYPDIQTFTKDGKAAVFHAEPTLKLLERKKGETVKKKVFIAINMEMDVTSKNKDYKAYVSSWAYENKQALLNYGHVETDIYEIEIQVK